MSAPPDNLDPIQKLLSLKRHEVPPPRFFKDFSGQVISHLDAPEKVKTWWQRLGFGSDLQPAVVCALGTVVSALLLFGILASFRIDVTPALVFRSASESTEPAILTPPGAQLVGLGLNNLEPIAKPEEIPSSTFPAVPASTAASPFGQFQWQAQKISWGGN